MTACALTRFCAGSFLLPVSPQWWPCPVQSFCPWYPGISRWTERTPLRHLVVARPSLYASANKYGDIGLYANGVEVVAGQLAVVIAAYPHKFQIVAKIAAANVRRERSRRASAPHQWRSSLPARKGGRSCLFSPNVNVTCHGNLPASAGWLWCSMRDMHYPSPSRINFYRYCD